jgi:hypothetical protein
MPSNRLTTFPGYCAGPSIAIDDSNRVHIAWEDSREGNEEIFYKRQESGAWTADERLTDAIGASSVPVIACEPHGRVCVAWCDLRTGSAEIMARQTRSVSAAEPAGMPEPLRTISLSPNPFEHSVLFRIANPGRSCPVIHLRILDLSGRAVWTTCRDTNDAGPTQLEWDARDDAGRSVGPGVFLYQISQGNRVMSGRVVHIR